MTAVPRPWSIQDFVAWEEAQPERYELADGMVRMMPEVTVGHSVISGNVYLAFRPQLQGGPLIALTRGPKVVSDRIAVYPDGLVFAKPLPATATTMEEPFVVVEVLSRATRGFDQTMKWQGYRHIPSLRHALFVDQEKVSVDVWSRDGTGWHVETLESLDAVAELPAIGCRLALADVYAETEILPPA